MSGLHREIQCHMIMGYQETTACTFQGTWMRWVHLAQSPVSVPQLTLQALPCRTYCQYSSGREAWDSISAAPLSGYEAASSFCDTWPFRCVCSCLFRACWLHALMLGLTMAMDTACSMCRQQLLRWLCHNPSPRSAYACIENCLVLAMPTG